ERRDAEEFFLNKNTFITMGEGYIRVSPHFYTQKKELDRFLTLLEEFLKYSRPRTIPSEGTAPTEEKKSAKNPSWAMVAGATGILGKQITLELLKRGYNVLLVAKNTFSLEMLSSELTSKFPLQTMKIYAVDYQNAQQVTQLLAFCKEQQLKFDVL